MKPNTPLYEFFDQHFVPSRPANTAADTFRQYKNGLSLFARFLNCTPRLSDLTDGKIAAFMVWLLDRGRAIGTVNKHRTMLVALVYVARRLELIDWWPEVAKIDTGPRRQSHSFAPHDVAKRQRQIARPCLSAADRIAQAPAGTVAHYYRATFVLAELAACSPRTRHNFTSAIAKFCEYSGGHTPMADLTADKIEAFYSFVRTSSSSRFTAKRYAQQLRRLLAAYRPDPYSQRLGDYYRDVLRPELVNEAGATAHAHYDGYLADFLHFAGQGALIADVTEDMLTEFRAWCSRQLFLSITSIDHRWRFIRRIVVHWRPKPPVKLTSERARSGESLAPEGSLLWLLEARYLPERNVGRRTEESYHTELRVFARFLGRTALIADLNKVTVNEYLAWSERQPINARTIKGRWDILRLLWRYAWDNELIADLPRGIRKLRLPPIVPTSWTMTDVTRLLAATQATMLDCWTGPPGRRVHVGLFLNAVVRLAYDSGLRKSDLFAVTWEQLQPDGRLVVVMQKTMQSHVCQLRPATVAALATVRVASDTRLLPWPRRVDRFYPFYRQLLIEAGLPVSKRNGLQKLRRTSASLLESVAPGLATWHLGHSTPTMARKHYLDPAVCGAAYLPPEIPEPPRLLEGPERAAS